MKRGSVGGSENSIPPGGFCFQFEDDGWFYLGGEGEAFGRPHSSVLPHQLVQGTRIQGPHGAGGDTDGFQSLRQSLDAKVAFLHLGILFRPKLRNVIGTLFCTKPAVFLAQTGLRIHDHNAIIFSLANRPDRAGGNTTGPGAMETTLQQERYM